MWSAQEILGYWFGQPASANLPDKFIRERWFSADKRFDREIRRRFMTTVVLAAEGGLDNWLPAAEGYLALIIILDQFPRHIYRNTSMAYDFDRQARKVCYEGLNAGADTSLTALQRAFFYMPLKHSERLADQQQSVALHRQLLAGLEQSQQREILKGFVEVAESHYLIVSQFNRFPQRNEVLKRASREEELEFLHSQSNSFLA